MHYLDHAATTPVPPQVAQAMAEALTENFGNPSAQYELGRRARDLVEQGRGRVAAALGCRPAQVAFTSCGTEGDNWAILAALHQNRRTGRHIVTTAVEHSAVLQCVKRLEQEGCAVTYVRPDSAGRVIPLVMTVEPPRRITYGNPVKQYIKASLLPQFAVQNVLWLSDGKAVDVEPDGEVVVLGLGKSRVHVIPTENTALHQTVTVEVVRPSLIKSGHASLLLAGANILFT